MTTGSLVSLENGDYETLRQQLMGLELLGKSMRVAAATRYAGVAGAAGGGAPQPPGGVPRVPEGAPPKVRRRSLNT